MLTPTTSGEAEDFFVIEQLESGSVILGSEFMVSKFFESNIVMSDGTFHIAPKDFAQIYILWFVKQETPFGESIPRNKAYPAFFLALKSKTTDEYREAFQAIERYR